MPFSETDMRTRVYVDGFNLYYGALKGTPFKWLDPIRLSSLLLPSACVIDKVLCFTARVSGLSDPGTPARQQVYLSALRTLSEVEVHFGSFLAKKIWRPLANLPVADRSITTPSQPVTLPAGEHSVEGESVQILPVGRYPASGRRRRKWRKALAPSPDAVVAEFHAMEEKGSDVNLAAHLLNDAWKGRFEAAAVISNDTDLVTPIRMVVSERGKKVFIVCPGRWQVAPKLTFHRGRRIPAQRTGDTSGSGRRRYGSVGPPAAFQAVYPPSMWPARSRPTRCATSVASAERQSRLQ